MSLKQYLKRINFLLNIKNYVWDLPYQKKSLLLPMEQSRLSGLFGNPIKELLKVWVAQGNNL